MPTSSMPGQIGVFLVDALLGLFVLALMLRFMLQWVRAPFGNPVGQLLLAVTDWVVHPVRRYVPLSGRSDTAILVIAWLAMLLKVWLIGVLTVPVFGPLALVMVALLGVIRIWLQVLWWAILIHAILSWVAPRNALSGLLHSLTEPLLHPLRRLLPTPGGVDLSPLVALLVGQALLGIVLPTIEHNLMRSLL